uniref:Growth hormone-regulated TBC protein 1 n=1 Tax=Xenopus tropicalis TaxID=8364 RepID=A0A6I8QDL7_XENTR
MKQKLLPYYCSTLLSPLQLSKLLAVSNQLESVASGAEFDYAFYEEFIARYHVVLTRRAIKWSKLLQQSAAVEKNMKVKRYIRKGIPNEHRSHVWMVVSGAQAQMDMNTGYFRRMFTEGEKNPKLLDLVITDLNRTFPDNVLFQKNANPSLQKDLYNVLVAYGQHNKTVGYCQPLIFIYPYPELLFGTEGTYFFLCLLLVWAPFLSIFLTDYYSPAMTGLKTDQEVLGDLVKKKIPSVAQLIETHGVMWTLLVSRWFICLFIDILPVETVLRIWDCLFFEGSKVIFRVALTLIKQSQASIMEARNFPDICDKFKEITKGEFVTDCHYFMQKIFAEPGSLSKTTIDKLREKQRLKLISEEK